MDWNTFRVVLTIGVGLVCAQAMAALFDGYFSQEQIRRVHHIDHAWSFLQHGGMWADVLIISPIVAYHSSRYTFEYSSWRAIALTIFVLLLTLALVEVYRRSAMAGRPEAHTHFGHTSVAGWIHAIFAFVGIWVLLEVFLGWTTPVVSKGDMLATAVLLTPFFYLGVKKFSPEWEFGTLEKVQVGVLTSGMWIWALWRII